MPRRRLFHGWWITVAVFFTFGIAVGIPYYGMPFFYDYYQKDLGWARSQITLGIPLAVLFIIWVGPVFVHRFSPRKLILLGTALTCIAFVGFGRMSGELWIYYALCFFYMVGYIFSGPIPHQVLIAQWFRNQRGLAMGVTYLGVGLFAAISAKGIAKPLTEMFGWHWALVIMGLLMFLAWPLALFLIRDRPAEMGLFPDGAADDGGYVAPAPHSFGHLVRQRAFWLLVAGSFCSIGSIGSINQHMKLIFLDQGFTDQQVLNQTFSDALFAIGISSMAGRIVMGWLADRFPKKYVMLSTYALVAITIPLLHLVRPPGTPYVFAILFGFGMGADYMLIPLMAAEQFGRNTLARAMAIILPTDTIGQFWFPYGVSLLRESFGSYTVALGVIFSLAAIGAAAVAMLPRHGRQDETLHVSEPARAAVGR
ncbi:MAG: MFS transporter [Acidobacteria bacterium]|nr:MFS transporter [Acidobacteriota bacterium]